MNPRAPLLLSYCDSTSRRWEEGESSGDDEDDAIIGNAILGALDLTLATTTATAPAVADAASDGFQAISVGRCTLYPPDP
jgi:hypothetical protein